MKNSMRILVAAMAVLVMGGSVLAMNDGDVFSVDDTCDVYNKAKGGWGTEEENGKFNSRDFSRFAELFLQNAKKKRKKKKTPESEKKDYTITDLGKLDTNQFFSYLGKCGEKKGIKFDPQRAARVFKKHRPMVMNKDKKRKNVIPREDDGELMERIKRQNAVINGQSKQINALWVYVQELVEHNNSINERVKTLERRLDIRKEMNRLGIQTKKEYK